MPADLTGRRTLDVGCNAGFYSFQLAQRGAAVTAIDHDAHYLSQARFAQPMLDPYRRVHFEQREVYSVADDEPYDFILFLGVLYHLRYPLLAIDTLADRLRPDGVLLLQTLTMPHVDADTDAGPIREDYPLNERDAMARPDFPKLAFIEHRWAGDPTNWFAPNAPAVEAMLRSAGLSDVAPIAPETWLASRPVSPPTVHQPRTHG